MTAVRVASGVLLHMFCPTLVRVVTLWEGLGPPLL